MKFLQSSSWSSIPIHRILVAAALLSSAATKVTVAVSAQDAYDHNVVSNIADLGYDENSKLKSYHLVYPSSPSCANFVSNLKDHEKVLVTALEGSAATKVFPDFNENGETETKIGGGCQAAFLELGTDQSVAGSPMPQHRWFQSSDEDQDEDLQKSIDDWFHNDCIALEICLMNYFDKENPIEVFWISPSGQHKKNNDLYFGESKTRCFNSFLGHEFIVKDHQGQMIPGGTFVVEHPLILGFGVAPKHLHEPIAPDHYDGRIKDTLRGEWERHLVPKRTFSTLGFSKGRLPDDVFASMGAFYYNNQKNKYREEWYGKGVFVNWWEMDVFMMQIPWNLKSIWAVRLADLVSEWAGMPCKETVMYGLRQYESGARLLTHVDRLTTHVVSLIVNVAQGNLSEDWPVEVYDHAGRLHEVVMSPGDIVYYESAKNLHSRNRALVGDGAYYTNLFTHYRPRDMDEEWYKTPTPESSMPYVDDIDLEKSCIVPQEAKSKDTEHLGYGKVRCPDHPELGKNLSPTLFVAKKAEDLVQWWERTTPPRDIIGEDGAGVGEIQDQEDNNGLPPGASMDELGNIYGIDDDDDDDHFDGQTEEDYYKDVDDDDYYEGDEEEAHGGEL